MSISRSVAVPQPDSLNSNPNGGNRASPYGDSYVIPLGAKNHFFADEGSYFLARNPTDGTGIATIAAATAYDSTKPFIYIYNANSNKNVILDYLKLVATAAGTNGTAINLTHQLDAGSLYTSGSVAVTPVNCNAGSQNGSGVSLYAGTTLVTVTATSAARTLGHLAIRPVIPVVGDTYYVNFGGNDPFLASLAVAGTAISNIGMNTAPVVIPPGYCWKAGVWLPSQSAASSYEFELGFIVR